MQLTLDEEPTGDEIQAQAVKMFGSEYMVLVMWGFGQTKEENSLRVDMEHAAEQVLVRERVAAKQRDFA
jgi:uncharacterized Rmd1/YagE family protein